MRIIFLPNRKNADPFYSNWIFWRVIRVYLELAGEEIGATVEEVLGKRSGAAGEAKGWAELLHGTIRNSDMITLAVFTHKGYPGERDTYLVPKLMQRVFLDAFHEIMVGSPEPQFGYQALMKQDFMTDPKAQFVKFDTVGNPELQYIWKFADFLSSSEGFLLGLANAKKKETPIVRVHIERKPTETNVSSEIVTPKTVVDDVIAHAYDAQKLKEFLRTWLKGEFIHIPGLSNASDWTMAWTKDREGKDTRAFILTFRTEADAALSAGVLSPLRMLQEWPLEMRGVSFPRPELVLNGRHVKLVVSRESMHELVQHAIKGNWPRRSLIVT